MGKADEDRRRRCNGGSHQELAERFRALAECSTDAICEISQDRRLTYVSPSFTRAFGYGASEILGSDVMIHVHPEDRGRLEAAHSALSLHETVPQLTFRYRHKNGSWRWVELTGCSYSSSMDGARAILINRDVTERVVAERELTSHLEAERRIAELSRLFVALDSSEFETGIQQGLKAAAKIAGADRARLFAVEPERFPISSGFQWSADAIARSELRYSKQPGEGQRWSAAKLFAGEVLSIPRVRDLPPEASLERECLSAEGVQSYLAIPIRRGLSTIACLDFFCVRHEMEWSEQEITRLGLLADVFACALRRHEAELSRGEAENHLQMLTEQASDAICEVSIDGRILYASPSFTELCGYTLEELRSKDPLSLVHPEDRSSLDAEKIRRITAGERAKLSTFRALDADGSWRWLEATARPFRTPYGEERVAVVFRDVTAREHSWVAMERQLAREKHLTSLAREFLERGADEVDVGIQHALEATGKLAGADRSWLVSMVGTTDSAPQHYDWCADGVSPRPLKMGFADRSRQRWVALRLARGEVVRVSSVSELPEDARGVRENLLQNGIRSFLAIPIRSEESLIGVLGFHSLREEKHWSNHEVSLLRLIAGMFTSALRRKRAEANLRESEERFRALAEYAKDPICEVNEDGDILFASPSFTDLLGYGPERIATLNFFSLIHTEDFASLKDAYAGKLQDRRSGTDLYRARHKNGDWLFLEGTSRAFRSASGEIRTVMIIRDVTERQRSQQALERQLDLETRIAALSRRFLAVRTDEIDQTICESLAELAALAEVNWSWLIAIDASSREVVGAFEWNGGDVPSQRRNLAEVGIDEFPWFARQLLRGNVVHVTDPSELPAEAEAERLDLERRGVRSFLGIPLHSGNVPVGFLGFETADRSKSWSVETITLLRLVGEIFVTALRRKHVEESLRSSQEQLMQAQKMEAVGTLAGGIAHDFNNQLTVILGNVRYVLRQVEDDEDLKDALTDLNRAAEHCAQLTRSLLAFSRRTSVSKRSLDVNEVVAAVQRLLRPLIPSSIEFEVEPPEGTDRIDGDPTQIQQVLLNLAINARDAMPDGGRLVITSRDRTFDDDAAAQLGLPKPGAYVELAVRDDGHGIDAATQRRIFEPFFTTKALGEGTGLGLATAYGIVTEGGGAITVETEVGVGSTFRVFLPRSAESNSDEEDGSPPLAQRGTGTVLVIEDEQAVRRFIHRTLQQSGYDVLEARDAVEALRIAESHAGAIDAAVTDVDTSQAGGIEFARDLACVRPGTPVLFLSGASRAPAHEPDGQAQLEPMLRKPFTEEAIIDEIRRLIAAGNSV